VSAAGAAAGAAGGCGSAGGGDAGAGVSLAGGVTAAVAGDGAAGADVEAAAASFAASEAGIAPVVVGVVVGAEVAVPDGGKYVVVPLDELWDAGSSAITAGTTPAQQTPNKLTPRRRRAKSLIIPRLAPIDEGRNSASVADTT
jgi:hypothetical protein